MKKSAGFHIDECRIKKDFTLDVLLPVIYALSECVPSVIYSGLSFLEIPDCVLDDVVVSFLTYETQFFKPFLVRV